MSCQLSERERGLDNSASHSSCIVIGPLERNPSESCQKYVNIQTFEWQRNGALLCNSQFSLLNFVRKLMVLCLRTPLSTCTFTLSARITK